MIVKLCSTSGPIVEFHYTIPDNLKPDIVHWLEWAEKMQKNEDKLKEKK